MTDDRLNQIQNMLTELVRIVGNTNAALEELRADVAVLKTDVAELKADVTELKADVTELKADVAELKAGQQKLEGEFANFKEDTMQKFNSLDISIEYLANKLIKHDMQLYDLKRRAK